MTSRIQGAGFRIQNHGRPTRVGGRVACALAGYAAGIAVWTITLAAAQVAEPTNPVQTERGRLLALVQQASRLRQLADGADTGPTALVDALRELSTVFDLLVAPSPSGDASHGSTVLPTDLRAELRRAARELAELAATADTTSSAAALRTVRSEKEIDGATLRVLVERVRTAVAGEVALGLTFQGSYSQTRPKDPVYGGHASAMGPAPEAVRDLEADAAPPVVRFEEGAHLPTRTWSGGPTKDHILESAGNGVALLDYDRDGWLDVFLVTAAQLTEARERIPHRNALYRNLGGWKFEDVSAQAGVDVAAWGNGVCAGDADGDGHIDLYVTNWGANFLFRNRGDGTFEETAGRAGVAAGGWSTGCTWFDADADGDLDLYVVRYVHATWDQVTQARRSLVWRNGPRIMVGPAGLPGESDLFFENLGNGRFQDATDRFGLSDPAGAYGFGVVATDYDDDGHVDLFVANDSNPNFLYRNLGNGRFESVGLIAGVAVNAEARAQAGMGAEAGDADGDGRMDLVLTTFAHDRNTLYRNMDGELFEDATVTTALAAPTFTRMGWGVAFVDADLDGRLDLFVANGHIFADVGDYPALGESYAQKNQLLLNTGSHFRDVSAAAGAGLQVDKVSRGLAVGDLDNDGDPDLVVSNVDDTPTLLENRQRSGHHWVGLRLTSPTGNRFAIGAKVLVEAGGRIQVREVRSGGSFLSQHDLRVLVGLGTHAGSVSVEVRMPGGARWRWTDVPVDRHHELVLSPEARIAQAEDDR